MMALCAGPRGRSVVAIEPCVRDEREGAELLEAGTRLVWVIDPRTHIVTVHHSLREVVILRAKDQLRGALVIPEPDIAVGELFE